jgi:type I restriction enzyme S subunit
MEIRDGLPVRNEVKAGYKNTEVGVIPEDWEVENILDDCTLKARIGWQGLTTAEYLETGNFGLVTGTDFRNGYIDWNNCVYVDKSRYIQDKNIQLRINDVLVTKDGTIGKVAFINKLPNPTTLNSGVFVIRPKNENIDNQFFYYLLMSFYFDDFLSKITAGSTITHLYQKDFSSFKFILPTKSEQTAIATALSDADALINSLEKLISKKRKIKQGAMQLLLKPKEEWEMKKLGEISENIGSGKSKTQSQEGKFPIFGSTGIIGWSNSSDYTGHKILVARVGANAGTVNIVNGNYCVSDNTLMVSLKTEIDLNFIFSFLILSQLNKLVFGSGQPLITGGQLKNIEISLPTSIEEQTRISTILSDMDKEIQALETKLEKYRKIKLGMMQNLLTGKIRLV